MINTIKKSYKAWDLTFYQENEVYFLAISNGKFSLTFQLLNIEKLDEIRTFLLEHPECPIKIGTLDNYDVLLADNGHAGCNFHVTSKGVSSIFIEISGNDFDTFNVCFNELYQVVWNETHPIRNSQPETKQSFWGKFKTLFNQQKVASNDDPTGEWRKNYLG